MEPTISEIKQLLANLQSVVNEIKEKIDWLENFNIDGTGKTICTTKDINWPVPKNVKIGDTYDTCNEAIANMKVGGSQSI